MTFSKLFTALLLCLWLIPSFAQDHKYEISPATDIKPIGINKVLCMKNGNTILFHFESSKDIAVKVYDSTHKQIADQKVSCRLLDLYIIKDAVFKGLFEVNGEAVLFMEQLHLSKYGLVRLRFNAQTGLLTDEKLMGESPAQSKRTRFYVMNNKKDEGYAILFFTDIPLFQDCKMNVSYYSNKHDITKDVTLTTDRKKYDIMEFIGAEWQPEGVCITTCLKKQTTNGTAHSNGDVSTSTISLYSHDVAIFYIPEGSSVPKSKIVELGEDIYPYYATFTFNPFARTVNLLVLSYMEYYYKFGTDMQPGAAKTNVLFTLDEETLAMKYKVIKNEHAIAAYREQTGDTNKIYEGLPVRMYTNNNGLSTLVSRSYTQHKDVGAGSRAMVYSSHLGHFAITQFDDEGNEIWGTLLPDAQYFISYQHYYYADELARSSQEQVLFGDMPPQAYSKQFVSQNIYNRGKELYIVYNDNEANFGNSMKALGDTVYNFDQAHACYYKMDAKKNMTKHYVFGAPQPGEYICSFIEGAGYDEKRGTYAALVQHKKGEEVTLRMAWSHLD